VCARFLTARASWNWAASHHTDTLHFGVDDFLADVK
jgi:hypothetical protein